MTKQRSDIVTKQFEKQVALYTNKQASESPITDYLLKLLKGRWQNKSLRICEFGGGGGRLLESLRQVKSKGLELHNCELVGAYKNRQASKFIHFHQKSILDSRFEENSFDAVFVRHVLHHLIDTSIPKTRKNQLLAIQELVRITKPGGYILIEEQVNNSRIACVLYFYLSNLATKLRLNIDRFQITPYTIVAYLTQHELTHMIKTLVPERFTLINNYIRWKPQWWWKLTMLMNDTGAQFLVIRKPR